MMASRRGRTGAAFAALIAATALLLAGGGELSAQEKPSEQQILRALKPGAKTRGLVSTPKDAEQQRFIDSLRTIKTRSLTTIEREKVAAIAKEKPSIDLEIYFEFDSAAIAPAAVPDLNNLGRALSDPELRDSIFVLSGHTDGKGTDDYNQRLSERRAQSVKRYLVQKFRLAEDSLVTAGYGEEQLKNRDDPFAAENRRVQIVNMEASKKAQR
jgi:outer membrane protein OmpA-like peptidoglycan-associated protein